MPAEGSCLRDLRCVLWGRGGGGLGLAWEHLGVAVGRRKRLKEGWCEELSPLAQSSLPFNNKSHVPSVTRCLFPGQTLRNLPTSFPPLSSFATSAGILLGLTRPSTFPICQVGRAGFPTLTLKTGDPLGSAIRALAGLRPPRGSRLPLSVN